MSTDNITPAPEQVQNIDLQPSPKVSSPETNVVESAVAAPVEPQPQVQAQVENTQVDETINQRQQFLDRLNTYYLETGDLEPVIKALSTDYSKMSPEEIIKLELRERYPGLSDDRFEKLYRKQVVEKYSLDSDLYDEEDVELGRELLARDAEPVRKRLLEKNQEWLPPTVDPKVLAEQQQAVVQSWQKQVTEDPANRAMIESKTVAIKFADTEFKVGVEPEKLLDISSDVTGQKFFELFAKKDEAGNIVGVDFELWNSAVAFVLYKEGVAKGLYDLGSSSSSRDIVEKDIKNIQIDGSGVPSTTPNADDEKTALLKAFLSKG